MKFGIEDVYKSLPRKPKFDYDQGKLSGTMHEYTGCPRRNVPDFGRVFLMLNYTDITQNTYIQS